MRNTKEHDARAGTVEQPDGSYKDRLGNILWYNEDGQYHRLDGPAVIFVKSISFPDGIVFWFVNDKEYTFDKWCKKLRKSDKKKLLLKQQYE
jgi:hypothetical protein